MIKMPTTIKSHPRKGTKGVKTHSRDTSIKSKKVNPFAGTRHVTTIGREWPMGRDPVEAEWNGKKGLLNMTKVIQEDIFSKEVYTEYVVAFREHGIKLTDPLSKRMGKEFAKPFKRKDKAVKFYKSLKVD